MTHRSADGAYFSDKCDSSSENGHPFRAGLPLSALTVEPDPQRAVANSRADDIRLFFLSFATFFLGISAFIW
ncbi:MAG: hypothetical protein AAGH53_08345 [Pseudomonadota bacterium]